MKNILLIIAFVGFMTSSYASSNLITSPENIAFCEGKCDKKDCNHKSKECKKNKTSCKKGGEKKSCCKKGKKECAKKETNEK
ncbi:MAG: hypothetical protein J5I47_05230 [Vicingus serpentipes]|nr:hypothetical protein [Vicingus serpentipes]